MEELVAAGEIGLKLAVNFRHLEYAWVEHGGHPGAEEGAEDFLGLAERVAEEDGRAPFLQGLGAEGDHGTDDFLRGGEAILREAEGRLHDERAGMAGLRGLGRKAGAELEVAGVEEGLAPGLQEKLRGAQDVSGGEERDAQVVEICRDTELQEVLDALAGHTGAHQAGGGDRKDGLGVIAGMIAVGMRDEGEGLDIPWIKPKALQGQLDPAMETHRYQGVIVAQPGEAGTNFGLRIADCGFAQARAPDSEVVHGRLEAGVEENEGLCARGGVWAGDGAG